MKSELPGKTPLARSAGRLAKVTEGLGLLLLLAYLALWIDPALARRTLTASLPGLDRPDLPTAALAGGFVLGLVPVLLMVYGLRQIRLLFKLYAGDDLFPARAGDHLRNFGKALLALIPAGILIRAGASLLFSAWAPTGERQLVLSISSGEIFILIVGALVMMIGRVLSEAHRMAEENRQFV